jgi:serine/threonine protein kinase
MTAPLKAEPPVEQFLQALQRCGLFSRDQLQEMLREIPSELRQSSRTLAETMIARKQITHFQARKLLKGTWQGLVLGPFRVMAPLGKGGMGAVYLAQMEGNSERKARLVALKILPPRRAKQSHHLIPRFQREMELAVRMDHPHLTRTFEAGEIFGIYYLAMEYIRGQSLSQLVRGTGPLVLSRAARLFSEVAEGLTYAHSQNVIHRDLKPSNIMVTTKDHAKILDLGLALAQDLDLPDDKQIMGGEGYVVGTMDYIAPEQVQDATAVDHRADLYSMGCTMFFTLSGQPPFAGGNSIDKMRKHLRQEPPFLSSVNPIIPPDFSRIIEKLMSKLPSRRFLDAEAVRQALLPWADVDEPLELEVADGSDSQAVIDLETANASQESAWEAMPIVPVSDGSTDVEDDAREENPEAAEDTEETEDDPAPRRSRRTRVVDESPQDWVPYLVWGLIACVGGITLVILISRLLR